MNKKRIAKTISITQLYKMFPTEEACYAWLEKIRWDGTPVCPHCGGTDSFTKSPSKKHTYWHKHCRKHFTVTTGTCMHATKKPLQDWIYAIYSVMTARKGVSAMQISKELGCAYRTAWHMLHRIREGCDNSEFKLSKIVESDTTYVGGKEKNKHRSKKLKAGRGTVGKQPVIGVRERESGKVRAQPIAVEDAPTVIDFIAENVEEGSTVFTDEAKAYAKLQKALRKIQHDTVNHSQGEYVRDEVHTNGIESVWALLKRALMGTWHYVSPKHLRRYVNEVTFRLNEGNCEIDTIDRINEFARGIGGKKLRYCDLVADNPQ